MLVLLKAARERGASDLILSPGLPPMAKVADGLVPLLDEPVDGPAARAMVYGLMDERQQALFEERKDLEFSMSLPGVGRFRVSAFHHHRSIGAVLRFLPDTPIPLEETGLPDVVKELLSRKSGLIMVAGPTGSGKSTTLASMVDWINRTRATHVITIEDPIEFVHAPILSVIHQREVGRDTQDFSTALRSALRQTPGVVMVGEVRDYETARVVLWGGETGHLILTSIHGSNVVDAVNRLINLFPEGEREDARNRLATVLNGIIAQKLLPSLQGGLVLAYEIAVGAPHVRQVIREGKPQLLKSIVQTGADHGMISFDACIGRLYRERKISFSVGSEYAEDQKEFSRYAYAGFSVER